MIVCNCRLRNKLHETVLRSKFWLLTTANLGRGRHKMTLSITLQIESKFNTCDNIKCASENSLKVNNHIWSNDYHNSDY